MATAVQFVQAHRRNSAYKIEGTDKMINYAGVKNILKTDRVELTEEVVAYYNKLNGREHLIIDDGVVKTKDKIVIGNLGDMAVKRHIVNVSTIWKAEQEAKKISPSAGANDFKDDIIMLNGELFIDYKNKPSQKGTYLHLMMHNQNADFPFRSDSIAAASFKINDRQKIAAKEIEVEDKKQEARAIIYELHDRKNKTYDKEKLYFYRNIFKKQLGSLDSDEEIFKALLVMADRYPDLVIQSVTDGEAPYQAVVQQAMDSQIIINTKGKLINTKTGKVLFTVKFSAPKHEVFDRLVEYYSGQSGEGEFKFLKNQVEAAKKQNA